jgi:hypothetical protein
MLLTNGGGTTVGIEVNDFSVPADCSADIFSDGFESGDVNGWSSSTE